MRFYGNNGPSFKWGGIEGMATLRQGTAFQDSWEQLVKCANKHFGHAQWSWFRIGRFRVLVPYDNADILIAEEWDAVALPQASQVVGYLDWLLNQHKFEVKWVRKALSTKHKHYAGLKKDAQMIHQHLTDKIKNLPPASALLTKKKKRKIKKIKKAA